jgi:hypothetical protein
MMAGLPGLSHLQNGIHGRSDSPFSGLGSTSSPPRSPPRSEEEPTIIDVDQ